MNSNAKKIVDLIQTEQFTFSFEVTPDVNTADIDKLDVEPAFFSVTWHAKSHKCKDLHIAPLKIACDLRNKQKQVLLHISCDLLKKQYLEKLLPFLQEKGICNLFLMLGESYDPVSSDFKSTLDLIKCVRQMSGAYFCIGVVGFCDSNQEQLQTLMEKIEGGADFIITQAFFDGNVFLQYKEKCAKIGINIPIIPGIFAFETYKQLTNFTDMCKVNVSPDLLEFIKKNENHKAACIDVVKKLVRIIRSGCPVVDFHLFTLNNLQNVCYLIKQIQN